MTDLLLLALTACAAAGCGLVAGVFLAFSSFVMSALARLPVSQGIAAMQSINLRAVTPVFMTAFLGTAVVCMMLAAVVLLSPSTLGGGYLIAGSVCYVVGSFLVTIVFNVPRNNRLAVVNPQDAAAALVWSDYLRSWTAWNHARTIAALAGAGFFVFWLYRHAGGGRDL